MQLARDRFCLWILVLALLNVGVILPESLYHKSWLQVLNSLAVSVVNFNISKVLGLQIFIQHVLLLL
jgi:hypothetical protein